MTQSLKLAVLCTSLALLLAFVAPARGQSKIDVNSIPFSPAPFRVGEHLSFNVSFSNFISAAHIELQVVSRGVFYGRDGFQLRAHVETTGMVNAALFAINNDYTTYVDPETGLPFHADQVLREASRTSTTSSDFAQSTVDSGGKQKSGFSVGIFDFLSALYRLRSLPLSEGSAYSLTVKGANESYQTEVRVTGRQALKTNVGSFNAIVCQVRVRNSSRADNFNIRIFFSDDQRHLPLLISARHPAGEIRAELAGSEFMTPPAARPSPTPVEIADGSRSLPIITQPASRELDNLPFKVGEQLNYQVYLGTMTEPAGIATFQVRSRSRYFDQDGLLFTVKAQTTNAAQRLFFANDVISSYVDPATLLPYRTEMNLIEGKRRVAETLTVNQDYGAANSDKGGKIDIPVGTHDLVSFFYALRTFNLNPPKRNAISILINNKPKTLFITGLRKETIRLGSQPVSAIQVSLTTDDPQSDKFMFRAWISDDKRRLPLRFAATTELGPLHADLAIIPVTPQ